jgi:hypothetical protein
MFPEAIAKRTLAAPSEEKRQIRTKRRFESSSEQNRTRQT